ncbi:2OG-Fe(II) oxygenase family oxidoreductase [Fonsecaea pedrosoi]|nr:2OG-Fe(II) oxygenase family oxidoreductase [Fonsecaea pedrosoi]
MAQTIQRPDNASTGYTENPIIYDYPPETIADCESSWSGFLNIRAIDKFPVDWADLIALDLSLFDRPGGKQKLAAQLKDADEIDRQFAFARDLFNLPLAEKLSYEADLSKDGYVGYRSAGNRELVPGVFDNIEVYGFAKFYSQFGQRPHPALIQQNISEIERFSRHMHEYIGYRLLSLIAIVLELPEDYFVSKHRYDQKSGCNLRYLKNNARTVEEIKKLGNTPPVRGHTDFGSLTMLFRQPVAGLQVKTPEGKWKYVKAHPASITVNIADMMDFVSNGYLKSSVHRVVSPPPDQVALDRIGVIYF